MNAYAFLILLLLCPAARAESFKAWAARASREEREKNDKDAFQSYSNALSSWKPTDGKPARAKILCARGALRDRGGDEAGALDDYTECLTVDKKNAKIFRRRGQLRFKSGKASSAIDDFYKAIALDIRFGAAYEDRAKAYEAQGDKEFAGEDYRHACELGVKTSCPKAKELAPARKEKGKTKAAAKPAPVPAANPAGEIPESADGSPAAAAPAAPASAKSRKKAAAPLKDDAPAPAPAAAPARETASPPAPSAAPAVEPATAPAPPAEPAPAPSARPKRRRAASTYIPRFSDCLHSLQTCVDNGAAFGACVEKAPACEQRAVKGCCPGVCLQDYRKALNGGTSEAEAYREIFIPESSCAAPPKSDDD